jgi:hypothetical protein
LIFKIALNNFAFFGQSVSPGIVDSNFIRASGYASPDADENMFDEMPKLKPEGEIFKLINF